MVAVPLQQRSEAQNSRSRRPLELIQGSLSARQLERRSPWLGNLHRIADGSLVGLGVAVLGLSALTLHWQGRWTNSFQSLESAQRLEHRLQESSAVLEQHHLSMTRKPTLLEPTSSEKLIYLPSPRPAATASGLPLLGSIQLRQIRSGY